MAYAIRRYRMEVMPFSKRRMTWLAQRNFTKMFTKWGGTRVFAHQTYAAFRHVLVGYLFKYSFTGDCVLALDIDHIQI